MVVPAPSTHSACNKQCHVRSVHDTLVVNERKRHLTYMTLTDVSSKDELECLLSQNGFNLNILVCCDGHVYLSRHAAEEAEAHKPAPKVARD